MVLMPAIGFGLFLAAKLGLFTRVVADMSVATVSEPTASPGPNAKANKGN
jgi:hypothetical protein